MELNPRPCHRCIAYDFGTSSDPKQTCRLDLTVIDKQRAPVGCPHFSSKPRFKEQVKAPK